MYFNILSIFNKIFKPETEKTQEYRELDISEYEPDFDETTSKYIRIVELNGFGSIEKLKKEIYDGNIIVMKVPPNKKNQEGFHRITKSLRIVLRDVNGDIAFIDDNNVLLVTPSGIKIDRNKIEIR